jgi:hypothetical protein
LSVKNGLGILAIASSPLAEVISARCYPTHVFLEKRRFTNSLYHKELALFPGEDLNPHKQIFKRVVMATPVSDGLDGYGRIIKDNGVRHTGGQARAGWLPSVGQPAEGVPSNKNKNGQETINKIADVCNSVKGDQSLCLANNVPHIKSLEYGWYGKWDGENFTPANTGKVINGFSRQSPHGMIGRVLAQAEQIFLAAVNAVKGGNA